MYIEVNFVGKDGTEVQVQHVAIGADDFKSSASTGGLILHALVATSVLAPFLAIHLCCRLSTVVKT
jgi:hypothetical protein